MTYFKYGEQFCHSTQNNKKIEESIGSQFFFLHMNHLKGSLGEKVLEYVSFVLLNKVCNLRGEEKNLN